MTGSVPERPVWADIVVGLLAGVVATQVTNLAQRPLKGLTPDHVERHEEMVRPSASSSLAAAQKLAQALGVPLSPPREELWGKAIHLAVGAGWGPVYGLLRRYGGLGPVGAAVASGAAMSLVLDEALVPALGLSAPSHHYHPGTRVRGFAAHLVYGAAVALAAEGIGRVVGLSQPRTLTRSARGGPSGFSRSGGGNLPDHLRSRPLSPAARCEAPHIDPRG